MVNEKTTISNPANLCSCFRTFSSSLQKPQNLLQRPLLGFSVFLSVALVYWEATLVHWQRSVIEIEGLFNTSDLITARSMKFTADNQHPKRSARSWLAPASKGGLNNYCDRPRLKWAQSTGHTRKHWRHLLSWLPTKAVMLFMERLLAEHSVTRPTKHMDCYDL